MTPGDPPPPGSSAVAHAEARGDIYSISGGFTQINYRHGQALPLYVNVPPLTRPPIGRDELITDLVDRLCRGHSPAISTAGLPGVGKTTLAVALARHQDVLEHFSDGVLWAGLGPTPSVARLQGEWATALGVDLSALPEVWQRSQALHNAIGQRRVLIVIDDAWQREPAQQLRCPGPNVVHLLTTRDAALARHFAGPAEAVHLPELAPEPSLALLQGLAPEACAADPVAARHLADQCGGRPLALELVGGYLAAPERSLFPQLSQAALAELADPRRRLQLAQQRLGAAQSEEQTLAAAIDLSLEPLPAAAQAAFYALGAFAPKPATFERSAAQAVSGADDATLALLVGRNLLEWNGEPGSAAGHLALHQVLADFARTRTPPQAVARQRDHYLALVNQDRGDWQRIEALYPQVQWAWQRQLELAPDEETLVTLADTLNRYQRLRGLRHDQLQWLEQALRVVQRQQNQRETARLLNNIGLVYSALGEKEQALALRRQVGDRAGEAVTLNNIGAVYSALGEKEQALAYYEQALPLSHQVGDRVNEARLLSNIGALHDALGEKEQALAYYEQALPLRRQVGDRWGERVTRYNLAMVYVALGNLDAAVAELEQVVAIDEAVGHPDLESACALLHRVQAVRQPHG